MKILRSSNGHDVLVDDEDFDYLSKFTWNAHRHKCGVLYAERGVYIKPKCKTISMHRVIMNITDRFVYVDHINGNGLDNRKCNLRICTHADNVRNRRMHKNNKSGYKGVTMVNENAFRSRIRVNGVMINTGRHKTAIEAAIAYNEAAIKYFGEFARLNIIKKTA